MIKIFHTGDLHLDSPIKNKDIKRSESCRERLRNVFLRMTSHIRENSYDLVLISGDLYEHGYLTKETSDLIKKELGSLGCPVFISPGNHDPYVRGSLYTTGELPENVFVFGEESLSSFFIDSLGVRVHGFAYTSPTHRENPLTSSSYQHEDGVIDILCAHTEVNSPLSPYAPMSYANIEQFGFTYAALGHIHKAPEPFKTPSLLCAYCGFGEGRAFDEIGKGSAMSVSLFEIGKDIEIKSERLSFSDYSFEIMDTDISGAESNAEIIENIRLSMAQRGFGKNNAVRIILRGTTSASFEPNIRGILKNCEEITDLIEIKDDSIPLLNGAFLENDITVRGEFYRNMKEKILSAKNEKERAVATKALRIGLAALDDRTLSSFLSGDETNINGESEA